MPISEGPVRRPIQARPSVITMNDSQFADVSNGTNGNGPTALKLLVVVMTVYFVVVKLIVLVVACTTIVVVFAVMDSVVRGITVDVVVVDVVEIWVVGVVLVDV